MGPGATRQPCPTGRTYSDLHTLFPSLLTEGHRGPAAGPALGHLSHPHRSTRTDTRMPPKVAETSASHQGPTSPVNSSGFRKTALFSVPGALDVPTAECRCHGATRAQPASHPPTPKGPLLGTASGPSPTARTMQASCWHRPPTARASATPVSAQLLYSPAARTEAHGSRSHGPRGVPGTHGARGEFWRVVVHVCHRDDGGGCVREAVVQVSLHVCGLHDDCILLNFLEGKELGKTVRQSGF